MRWLLKRDIAPPQDSDGHSFRYTHSETGHVSWADDYNTWMDRIRAHRVANNLPIMSDMAAVAEDQLCGTLPPDRCQYEIGDSPPVNIRIGFNQVVDWIKAVGSRFFSGEPLVEQAEAECRAAICVGCPLNVNPEGGCGACTKLAEFLTPGISKRRTPFDERLRSCAVCGCYNRVQVHFPLEILRENDTPERQAAYPSFCWKKEANAK